MEIVGTIGGDWDGEETFAAGGDEEGFVGDLGAGFCLWRGQVAVWILYLVKGRREAAVGGVKIEGAAASGIVAMN